MESINGVEYYLALFGELYVWAIYHRCWGLYGHTPFPF
jgi:hypothetical protein